MSPRGRTVWLDLIERRPTTVVVPSTDASIAALRPRWTLIEQHSALALASQPALDLANDKARTLALAAQVGIRTQVRHRGEPPRVP